MASINLNDLKNAKLDVDHIAAIATSAAASATDRLGNVKDTVKGAIDTLKAFNSRGAWAASTTYAVKDIVTSGGTWYVCVTAHTSSVVFATDSGSKWRVHQGLTASEISQSSGASIVGFLQVGANAIPRTVQDKFRESVSVKDFGAKGDGTTDDATAIQACHDYCAGDTGKRVYYPAGNYYISRSIIVQSFANIYGDGPTKSRINLQGKAYTGDVFINAVGASSWSFMSVQEIAIRGGTCAFHCSAGTQEQWYFKNVSMELQTTAGILSDRDWQCNNFTNVQWYYCFQAIRVNDGFNNHNSYYSPQFNGITGASLYCLSSNEGNNFYGARFEAGGLNGNITIQVANSRNLNFYGGYVENTHNNFLSETGSSGTSFYGLHWTGALTGSTPFVFSSDSEVTFGANSWGVPSDGPAKMRITGDNEGKLGNNNTVVVSNSRNHKHSISPWIACPASLRKDLVTISKVQASGANTTVQALTGILTVTYTGLETGGFGRSFSRRYHVFASAVGFGTITPLLALASSVDAAGSATLVVQVKAGATGAAATLEAVFTGLVPATQISSALQYSFEHTCLSTTLKDYLKADLV